MKKMKKPTSILLAVLMCLSIAAAAIAVMPATALAELKTASDADSSTIRVKLSSEETAKGDTLHGERHLQHRGTARPFTGWRKGHTR